MSQYVEEVLEETREKLKLRIEHLDESLEKAKEIMVKARTEKTDCLKAIKKLGGTKPMRTGIPSLAPKVKDALQDGPLTYDQLKDVLQVNGDGRRLAGTLSGLTKHGRLRRDGEQYELVPE